jgi:hypothetical protein
VFLCGVWVAPVALARWLLRLVDSALGIIAALCDSVLVAHHHIAAIRKRCCVIYLIRNQDAALAQHRLEAADRGTSGANVVGDGGGELARALLCRLCQQSCQRTAVGGEESGDRLGVGLIHGRDLRSWVLYE